MRTGTNTLGLVQAALAPSSPKTGWYFSDEHQDIGWYVGWHQVNVSEGQETETYVFAFNMDIDNRDKDPAKRIPATEAILAAIQNSSH